MSAAPPPDTGAILIVDDAPGNLAVLHDALDRRGFTVRVATSGLHAIESATRLSPDLILLDAAMPGIDGFETCRRLKALLQTRQIPVIFMTGLTDTDDVVRGFQAGGADYVTKPVRPLELIARISSHLRNSRLVADTLGTVDAAGDAIVAVDAEGRVQWATPLARTLVQPLLGVDALLPLALRAWLHSPLREGAASFALQAAGERLVFTRIDGGMRLLVQRQAEVPEPVALARTLGLTAREAEVLHWVVLGKTNPEIGTILALSPRTVNKHLEHVFAKLNVQTRTAAAAVALNRGRIGAAASA